MESDYFNTKQVAEYLGIHEKQVYALIKEGDIPCTRVTGKWLFKKDLIDRWIVESSSRQGRKPTDREGPILLAAGSNDPVLDLLLNAIQRKSAGISIFSSSVGSTEGLSMLGRGLTSIAWCHLSDPDTGEHTVPFLERFLGDRKTAVVHLFYREVGILYSSSAPVPVKGIASLKAPGMKFVNRQAGSGTRIFFDRLLETEGISPSEIAGYDMEAITHLEVGLSILSGSAHAGIASGAVATLLNLPFIPLTRESFDMVLDQETFFSKTVQGFIKSLASDDFRRMVSVMGPYDFSESGRIIHP